MRSNRLKILPANVDMSQIRTILFILCFWPCIVHAGYTGPMRFVQFWPCSGNASFCAVRVLAEGVIGRDSARDLENFLVKERSKDQFFPLKPTICFDSPGGDLRGALELGKIIRKLGFDTCLAPNFSRVGDRLLSEEIFVKNAICASACTFSMLGGVNRLIEPGSRLGVHQFYGANGNVGDALAQKTMVFLAAYIEEMGVKRSLLDTAALVPSSQMYWLSPQELVDLGIDNMVTSKSSWKLEALNDGSVVALITQIKPGTRAKVSLMLAKVNNSPSLAIFIAHLYENVSDIDDALAALNDSDLVLRVDEKVISKTGGKWVKTKSGGLFISLPLSNYALQKINTGQLLYLSTNVGHAVEQYDASLDFPLTGIKRLIPAVIK